MSVQATLDQFVNSNNNKPLDYDGQYGPQCMDEINFWAKALGKRTFSGNAIDVPGQNHDQWTWVGNTPAGVPSPGSIVCFAANIHNPAIQTTQFGHVSVFLNGDPSSFNSLDQNWNGVQRCEQIHHASYAGVLGWLAPVDTAPVPQGGMAQAVRVANVRMAPSVNAAVTSVLQAGNTFTFTSLVTGDDVNQNGVHTNQWYHSTLGHFVWAGNCKTV